MGMLEIKNLSIHFGGIRALNGIDLAVRDNEILSIIGPNGSGKTTLFNCLTGIYRPDQGDMVYQGESLLGLSPDAIAIRGIARKIRGRFKITIILVEHDLKIASRLADSMTAFNYGKKIARGTPEC